MTTSRSIASRSNALRTLAWLAATVVALAIVLSPSPAAARRRLVVLEFTGPKAEAFQDDVEKLLKKGNSVVPRKKWESAADDLGATKLNEKNVKKIARKLSIDGVISGRVEKRGSRYILHLQLREGKTGKTVAAPDIVERSPSLGVDGRDTIKTEMMPIIDDLPPAGGDDEDDDEGGDDDDGDDDDGTSAKTKAAKAKAAKAKGKGKGKARDEDEDEDDDEAEDDGGGRKGWKGRGDNEDDGDDDDGGKAAKAAKAKAAKAKAAKARSRDDDGDDDDGDDDRVAASGDDDSGDDSGDDGDDGDDSGDDGGDDDIAVGGKVNLTNPRRRAMDVAVGLSFTGRKLSFTTNLMMNRPQGYDGGPVPGIYIAADIFPLAFNRRNKGITRNLGISIVIDRVLSISSNLEKTGMVYELPTSEHHLAGGVVYRQPVGRSLQLEGSIRYNKRKFFIDRNNPALLPADIDIPNTDYSYVDPGVGMAYVLGPKMVIGADARFLLITDTGEMQSPTQYGAATVTGGDVEGSFDYQVAPKILVRAAVRFTTIGYAFKGNGELTNNRDGDATTVDVSGARDTYFGGFASGVYLF